MKNKFLYLLLFTSSLSLLLSQGCASPSCSQYAEYLSSCTNKLLEKYGGKTKQACSFDGKKKCPSGQFCIKESGAMGGTCFAGENTYSEYKQLIAITNNSCNPIFATRYKKYVECSLGDGKSCNPKKLQACAQKHLQEPLFYSGSQSVKNKASFGTFFIGFLIFLVLSIIIEGILVFVVMKFSDRSNPKNTIVRGIIFGALLAVITYPFVYMVPLPGMLISSSLLLGLLIVTYHQEVSFASFFTGLHVIWVWGFFSFFTANGTLHSESWLQSANDHRYASKAVHKKLHGKILETEKDRKRRAELKKREAKLRKERAEKEKKEKAEKARKAKEAKEAEEKKKKKKRRRRRRRR